MTLLTTVVASACLAAVSTSPAAFVAAGADQVSKQTADAQRWIVGLPIAPLQRSILLSHLRTETDVVRELPFAVVVDMPAGRGSEAFIEARWVERESWLRINPRATPDDPLFAQQWYLSDPVSPAPAGQPPADIDAEPAWDTTRGSTSGGAAIRVAVLDDGFDLTHPDLVDRFVGAGQDFSMFPTVTGSAAAGPGDWHGTWTSGVIGATGFNNVGVSGVCPECLIIPVSLTRAGGPAELFIGGSSAAEAIVWAVDQGAAVINNSWGPPDGNPRDPDDPARLWPEADSSQMRPDGVLPQVLQDALVYAATQGRGGLGTLITWSSGNGNELLTYDAFARDPRVLAIGAVTRNAVRAFYSDFGPPLFAVAPSSGDAGEDEVVTTDVQGSGGEDPGDYTATFGGTSASAAVGAGIAALVVSARPDLTAAQVTEVLALSAAKVAPLRAEYVDGRSKEYGWGRLDAAAAIGVALSYGSDSCTQNLEVCANTLDDDCNGVIDDPARCVPCIPDNPVEFCDGRDNNCDGQIDEDFVCETKDRPTCAPCVTSMNCESGSQCQGALEFPGSWCFPPCIVGSDCPNGMSCGASGFCELLVSPTGPFDCDDYLTCRPERCDGLDNDCDGTSDNIPQDSNERSTAGRQCRGVGVCINGGAECVGGGWRCSSPPSYELDELSCDGLDNDCDGEVDEGRVCKKSRGCHQLPGTCIWAAVLWILHRFGRRALPSKHSQ